MIAELRGILERHRRAFAQRTPGYRERMDTLRALEQTLLRRKQDIADAISADFGGRAVEETLALELFPTIGEIRHTRGHLREWMNDQPVSVPLTFLPASARVVYQPLGVVGVMSPWNYPLLLSVTPVIAALAAGNHVVVKPSEVTPRMSSLLPELFDSEYVSVVQGGVDVATEFASLPFAHLLFTGSTRVGKMIMRAASENLTPVTLELGGKSPAIVHRAYPLRKAVERIVTGKLYNAGQTCVAPDYALVPRGILSGFVAAAASVMAKRYPRLVDNADYTRIINEAHYRRLEGLVREARERGADVVAVKDSGERCTAENRVFPPTLISGAPEDTSVMQEEIFGPILPVVPYDSLHDAIAYVNSRPHPLALYYFDNDSRRANGVIARTASGGVAVNDCVYQLGVPDLPFGGVGPSGMGAYHGYDGFVTFSKKRPVFQQARWTGLALFRPPYTNTARRLLGFLLKG